MFEDGNPVEPFTKLEDADALLMFTDLAPSDFDFPGFHEAVEAMRAKQKGPAVDPAAMEGDEENLMDAFFDGDQQWDDEGNADADAEGAEGEQLDLSFLQPPEEGEEQYLVDPDTQFAEQTPQGDDGALMDMLDQFGGDDGTGQYVEDDGNQYFLDENGDSLI